MDGGSLCVGRELAIDAALIGDVLRRLRRDTPGGRAVWTLGGHGTAELDIDFFPVFSVAANPAWTTTARLWDPAAVAMVHAVLELAAVSPDSCELILRPEAPLSPWWAACVAELLALARAALDEVAEELLWYATRSVAP